MDRSRAFEQYRGHLFAIAYRMLGTVGDAEDVVQDAFVRWLRAPDEELVSPKAYLTTIATRLAIDQLRSARRKREEYVGPWLPEPVLDARREDPRELADSLSAAFLVLLESLTPVERSVFLLREVFEYEYQDIATIVEKSATNCRQIFRRAKERVAAPEPKFASSREERDRILRQFLDTVLTGDLPGLEALLAEDVVHYSDSNGKVPSAGRPVRGRENVARLFIALGSKRPPDFSYRFLEAAGGPALVTYVGGKPQSVITLDVIGGEVRRIFAVLNPEKLERVPS